MTLFHSTLRSSQNSHLILKELDPVGEIPPHISPTKGSGQQVAVGGAHGSERTGQEKAEVWPKQRPGEEILDMFNILN